jgi:signal transduction histidine kinase
MATSSEDYHEPHGPTRAPASPMRAPARETPLALAEEELFRRIGWFIRLRWLAVVGATGVLLVAWYLLGLRFAGVALAAVLLAVLFYNTAFAVVANLMARQRTVTTTLIVRFANVQISLDLIALALLIHFGGGAENFFVTFFIFHMIIASELLSPVHAYLQATLATLLVNGVCWLEYFGLLRHHELRGLFPHLPTAASHSPSQDWLYVFMVTTVATVTLYLSVYMASSIASRLRARQLDLERAYRRLQAVDSQKSYFLRRAGHGLRAPLSAIQSLLRLVAEGFAGEPGERARGLIARAIHRTEELIALVNDLLRYSRLQAQTDPEARQPVSLDTIVSDAADSLRPLADEKGVSLAVTAEPTTVLGDPENLNDLVTNLITNALKYTPAAGSVRVLLTRTEAWASLTVSDTGIGIPPEAREHLFEEFYRAPNAKALDPGGTGLGLAIVKRVVTMQGGDIRVESTPAVGSTFSVRLPLSEQPARKDTGWPPPETP